MAQHVNPMALAADDPAHPLSAAYACLLEHGLDGAGEALRLLVDQASLIEREAFIGVAAYERGEQRRAHANGFKNKSMLTRMGKLDFSVPQVREGGFYPSALERGARSERAMNLALAEMYVQGISTRKMIEVLQKLVGPEMAISSTQVSRCNAALDEGLAAWRNRPLDETPYVIFDARYERVRYANQHIDCAVLVALGVTASGHRRVLGVSVSVSEAEVHWREFMQSLLTRGLCGVRYIVSDDHAGLRAARQAMFPATAWQRCQFHLQQNAQKYVARLDQRAGLAHTLRTIFAAPDRAEAERLLARAIASWRTEQPKLAAWAEANIPEGFAVFALPEAHRVRMRTTNGLERLNKEIKRRTRVACLFPNPESCLRLVSAILAEQDDEWLSAKIYLAMPTKSQHP
jgi:putative transposase